VDAELVLDDALVKRDRDMITWTIPLDGSLAPITDSLVPTDDMPVVLTRPRAFSQYHIGLQTYMEGDSTPAGRTVTLSR
jgi:hypothetical protein